MSLDSYSDAKAKFLSGDYSVETYFEQNSFVLESAYCKLLKGDIEAAKIEFLRIENIDFRANWALKIIQFIQNQILSLPTYFQIRNFLELDLNLFLLAQRPEFVENVINGADLLYSVNPESYKFISRVMYNNDFLDIALYFLNRAKDKFYRDPEMHYMLANTYLKLGDKSFAKQSALACLDILPAYFPAQKFLDTLE